VPRPRPTAGASDRLDLAAYLRAPETQPWIAGFGRGRHDDQPLFFPVSLLWWPLTATRCAS
jgi:hypothetical protein